MLTMGVSDQVTSPAKPQPGMPQDAPEVGSPGGPEAGIGQLAGHLAEGAGGSEHGQNASRGRVPLS